MAYRVSMLIPAALVLVPGIASPAIAQQTDPEREQGGERLEEIVVTAQKRSESLQRTPVSVTALGAGALEDRSIGGIADLQGSVPGLVIGGNMNFGGINSIVIRGVSSPTIVIGTEEAVGVYLDGVFLPRSDAAFFNFADVERIEVLRGPQGTLYGRNSTAGAINVLTRTPDEALEGRFEASLATHRKYDLKGYLGGPLSEGVAASVSVVKSGHDGHFINANTGNRVGMQDDLTARGKLVVQGGALRATLAADYSLLKSEDLFQNVKNAAGAIVGIGDPDVVETEIESEIFSRRKSYGVSLNAVYEASDALSITSISSQRWYRADVFADTDGQGTPAPFLNTLSALGNRQFNQELRANYISDDVTLTAGLNYFEDKSFTQFSNLTQAGTALSVRIDSRTKAYAAFAQAEWMFAEGAKLIGGLRYNVDRKKFAVDYLPLPGLAGSLDADSRTDRALLPKIGLTYQASPTVFLFATISRGYRAGGYSPTPGRLQPVGPGAAPERLWNYEAGVKSELFDRRLRLNTTLFHTTVEDLQVRETLGPGNVILNNAGDARVYGAEFEANAVLGGGFSIDSTLSLLDGKYGSLFERGFAGSVVTFDRSGNRMIRSPRLQFSVNGNYETAVATDLTLRANLRYYRESKSFYSAANDPAVDNDGWYTLDARLALAHTDGWEAFVFGKNLTDKRYLTTVNPLGAYFAATVNDPRIIGGGVKYSF